MTAEDYGRSITLSADALDLKLPEEMGRASAALGYATRLSYRKTGRDLGLKTLPGAVLYANGRRVELPEEDLTVLLPGEAE